MIKLTPKHVFHGPNPYATEPVLIATLDISTSTAQRAQALAQSMEEYSSDWFESEVDTSLPSDLFIGQFLTSWCLSALNRERGYLHEAGARRGANSLEVWLGYHHPKLTYEVLHIAIRFFIEIASGKLPKTEADSILQGFWKLCHQHHPDFQAKVLMAAARHASIPYRRYLDGTKFWQFGWGENARVFFESRSSEEPYFGNQMAGDKALSKVIMSKLGVPIARHILVRTEDELTDATSKIDWPCVAKPLDAAMAKGVSTDIRNPEELLTAFRHAKQFTQGAVMVEAHLPGDVYRLLVVRGKLLVAVRRECPYIVADGTSSVGLLVEQLNEQRDREGATRSLRAAIPKDDEYLVTLSKQGLAPDSVAETDRKVTLRRIPFQNVGGINTNVTETVHRDVRIMAESLAESLGIQVAGLDYVTEDISTSYHDGGAVVEINLDPALPPMVDDMLSETTLGQMVLGNSVGRIPIDLLLIRPDQLAEITALLPHTGELGWHCNGRIGIGPTILNVPKETLVDSVANLLRNRTVQSALIVLTHDDLKREGMPVDRVDRVLLQDQAVAESWRNVLEAHSEQVQAVSSATDVSRIIRR